MSEHGYAPGHRVSEFAGGFPPIANVLGVRVNSGASSLSALRGLEVSECARARREGSSAVRSGAFPPPPPIPGAVCKGDRGRPFSFCFPQCSCQLEGRETSRREAGVRKGGLEDFHTRNGDSLIELFSRCRHFCV